MGTLAGCSLFGVATKGDLEKQNQQVEAEVQAMQQMVETQTARVAGQLSAMEGELNVAMADLKQLQQNNSTELTQIRTRFETIQGQLHLALEDLENVAQAIGRAEAGSRQAVKLHQDAQMAERERLQARLRELDVQIGQWYQPETPVPGPATEELPPDLQPEISSSTNAADHSNRGKPATQGGLQIPDPARK